MYSSSQSLLRFSLTSAAAPLGTLVTTPLFDSHESYIEYPPLTNIHNDLRIDMEFKPMDEDGLMFFIGGKKMKVEDFVTLSLVAGHVEFRYELGTGEVLFAKSSANRLIISFVSSGVAFGVYYNVYL